MVEEYCAEHNITLVRTEDDRLAIQGAQAHTDVEEHLFFLETREDLIIELNTSVDSLLDRARNLETEMSSLVPNFTPNSDNLAEIFSQLINRFSNTYP